MVTLSRQSRYGMLAVALMGLLGLAISVYNYVTPGSGIDGAEGTLLVIVSSALIFIAGLVLALVASLPRWLRGTLTVLMLLGILGTGLAAYFLESTVLIVLMVIALVGWLVYALAPGGSSYARPAMGGAQ